MIENVPPHPNPLPQRGEGVRRGIFVPLLIKSKKGVILLQSRKKNFKKF
jgi:hypothetical protein